MNGGATIFDDRETVELLRDHPQLLAIADAVRATQGKPTSTARRPLLVAAAAVSVCAVAAVLIAFVVLPSARTPHSGAVQGPGTPHHIALAPANSVPLSQASSDTLKWFGAPLILPDTSVLNSSDVSAALEQSCVKPPEVSTAALCEVNVQFSSPAVGIEYDQTSHTWGAYYPDALDQYQREIAQATSPSRLQIVSISGTPALIETGDTGNSIEFRLGKLSISIWAPDNNGIPTTVDASTLQAFAQSMLNQAGNQ